MYTATPKLQGFTIIELLMTLVIAGVLATLAAPSFVDVIKNNRMTTQYNDLLASLSLARSEAIKQGANVIALSNNGTSWENGWTIFIDADSDGTVDAGEELRVNPTLSGGNTLKLTDAINSFDKLTYDSRGLAIGIAAGTTQIFTLCDDRPVAKGLVVSTTGRIRHALPAENTALVCP